MENPDTGSPVNVLDEPKDEPKDEPEVRDRSPIRRINGLRATYKLTTDEDDDLSHLFLTSATIDMDKKAYGDRRYIEGILEVCHSLPLILIFSG